MDDKYKINENIMGESMGGNDSNNGVGGGNENEGVDISENGAVRRGEGLGGASKAGDDSISGLEQKGLETTENGQKTENDVTRNRDLGGANGEVARSMSMTGQISAPGTKAKKGGVPLWAVVLLVVVVLTAGVGAFYMIRQNSGVGERKPLDASVVEEADGDDTEDEDQPDEPEVEELSIDNQVVQRLYGNFRSFSGMNGFGFRAFYNGINDSVKQNYTMVNQAIANMEPLAECRQKYSEYDMERCYDVTEVKVKMREMFGTDVIEDNPEATVFGTCGDYTVYSEETQELLVPIGCGGSGPISLDRWLYRAERDEENIYIYDLVISVAGVYDENGEYVETVYCRTLDMCLDDTGKPEMDLVVDLGLGENEVLVSDAMSEYYNMPNGKVIADISKYADKMLQFKWTFTKNADGEYVFAGLEKVN